MALKSMDYLFGTGEVSKSAKEKDWSKTVLGPIETWPEALKTILGILFHNRHPMFLFWGGERICFYNDGYLPILSQEKHPSSMGQPGREVWPEVWDLLIPQLEDVFERCSGSWHVNDPFDIKRNGVTEKAYFTYAYSPVFIQDGVVGGALVTCVETTELVVAEQKVRQSEERLSQALESASMGSWHIDLKDGQITVSEQTEVILGQKPQSTYGASSSQILHPEDQERTSQLINQAIQNHSAYSDEYRIIRPDGEIRWVQSKGRAQYNSSNEPLSISGIILDVTDRKRSEETILAQRNHLKKALESRDEFLSIASHELKTPLTSLKLQAQLFKRAVDRGDDEGASKDRLKKLCEQIDRHITRLVRLIDDMLDISRIRSGKLTMSKEKINLDELFKDVILRMKPQFLVEGCGEPKYLCQSTPVIGCWDLLRIEQVITNLFTNAIRYGKNRPVVVKLSQTESEIRFSVRDLGVGISQDNLLRIFNRFERIAHEDRVGGLGLGLFICQQIVHAHGGRIWVESKIGEGSEFFVELPKIIKIS